MVDILIDDEGKAYTSAGKVLLTPESGGSGYSELPSYQVSNGVASRRSVALTGNEFSNITSIGDYGMSYAFYNCSGLTGMLNLSSVTSIGYYGMIASFQYCSGLTSVNLSSVTSIGNNGMSSAFTSCSGLTSVNLSSLTSIERSGIQSTFGNCSRLTSVNLSSLTSIGDYGMSSAFYNCSGLTSVNLSSVTRIGNNGMSSAFTRCSGLTSIFFNALTTTSFGSYVNQFQNMFDSSSMLTSGSCIMHFPSNLQSTISGLTGYPLFGATSGRLTLAFDLPATS